jgi:hypothetical protein
MGEFLEGELLESLLVEFAQLMILDLDVAHGGLRGAVAQHLGEEQQGDPQAGHVGGETMAKPVGVGGVDAAAGSVVSEDAPEPRES